ncbi:uncharacterized protein [Elaeis guineensis]|uniref:uncharacterized protein isoform X2 n=1 Tax=Elaeis guineensis var. tenera TaxID=51953 RepID=UPI003C6DABF1
MPATSAHVLSPESLSAAGRAAERLSLPTLQSKMKCDPEGYEAELLLLYRHFESSLHLFRHQSALSPSSDPAVAKDLGDLAMFLAHVTPFYLDKLADFPRQIAELLHSDARSLPSSLRCHLAQALILLVNRKIIDLEETLELFMDLQILGDRTLRKLAFSHVVHNIRRMNQKHKNEAKNRKLQNILFLILQGEEELRAKRSLVILCDLHRRRVWFDDRTANAICNACFHTCSRIMIAALAFLLGYERVEEEDDSEASSSEDETSQQPQIVISKEAVYKGFAEKLFSRLQKCNERFEVRMMMLKVIARTVGLHHLILLNFYPFLQKYVQPHQRDVTELLAAAVQACHDMVPPDAVEPLFKQIVNQFVHDRSRTEAIAVGLNVVREICLRMPLLMNEDLLQDLVLYKKSHEKAVSTAARSLMTLFREICPSLLVKKDRGRPIDPKARPKAFGEVSVASNVPGVELLQHDDDSTLDSSDEESNASDTDNELNQSPSHGTEHDNEADSEEENAAAEDNEEEDNEVSEEDGEADGEEVEVEDGISDDGSDYDDLRNSVDGDLTSSDEEEEEVDDDDKEMIANSKASKKSNNGDHDYDRSHDEDDSDNDDEVGEETSKTQKRKFINDDGQLNSADTSLRVLKRLAGAKMAQQLANESDGILSNEDFQRIKELKAKREAKLVMAQHGFKIPSSDQLTVKRVDPAKLEANIKRKLSKEERLALVRAGREDRGKYHARTAVKQKKAGGLSNRQKEHKKAMPIAAKRAKAARSRQERKKQQRRSGKQFLGKKGWK